jgi:hypothetical protein
MVVMALLRVAAALGLILITPGHAVIFYGKWHPPPLPLPLPPVLPELKYPTYDDILEHAV